MALVCKRGRDEEALLSDSCGGLPAVCFIRRAIDVGKGLEMENHVHASTGNRCTLSLTTFLLLAAVRSVIFLWGEQETES